MLSLLIVTFTDKEMHSFFNKLASANKDYFHSNSRKFKSIYVPDKRVSEDCTLRTNRKPDSDKVLLLYKTGTITIKHFLCVQ